MPHQFRKRYNAIKEIFISHIHEDDSGLSVMKELWLYPEYYLPLLNCTVVLLPTKSNLCYNSSSTAW